MKIPFIKMHGAGNDYVFVDCLKNAVEQPEKLAVAISDRHFGVGSDGLVLILPSKIADCKMRIFNADGSEAKMCGNAVRCIGKYLFENINNKKNLFRIETLSGIKISKIFMKNNVVNKIKVDMGKADFVAKNIPMIWNSDTCINQPLTIDEKEFIITAVSVGNPHCVVFCENVDEIPLETLGRKFEHHKIFPERVNTEFIQIIDNQTIKMRVWENGSGETMACGTGACASVAAAVKNALLPIDTEICVQLKGGEIFITCKPDYQIFMQGDAVEVFRGDFSL